MVIRQTIKIDVCLAKTSFKTRLSGQCIVTNNEILEPGEPQLGLILSVERLFSPKIKKTKIQSCLELGDDGFHEEKTVK